MFLSWAFVGHQIHVIRHIFVQKQKVATTDQKWDPNLTTPEPNIKHFRELSLYNLSLGLVHRLSITMVHR